MFYKKADLTIDGANGALSLVNVAVLINEESGLVIACKIPDEAKEVLPNKSLRDFMKDFAESKLKDPTAIEFAKYNFKVFYNCKVCLTRVDASVDTAKRVYHD